MIDSNSVPALGTSSFQFKSGGHLDWWHDGGDFHTELVGRLSLNNAGGSCARMLLDSLYHGPIIKTEYGGEVCAPDGGKHNWVVDFTTADNANVDNMRVSLKTKTASHDWSILDSAYSPPQPPSDQVHLHSEGFDFGDNYWSWVTGETGGSGIMPWNQGDGASYTPRLIGTLWLNNVAGVCARMHLIYNDDLDQKLTDKYGGPACAAGNDLQSWNIDLSPYTSSAIRGVTVRMQTQASNGSWNDIAGAFQTVSMSYF